MLTACQAEVLTLIRKGKSNKEIAQELNISLRAAKARVTTIYERMGIPGEGRSKIALDSTDRLKDIEMNCLLAFASLSQRMDRLEHG